MSGFFVRAEKKEKTMSKPVLAVDIDDVLFSWTPTFLEYHNTTHNTRLTPGDRRSDFLEEVIGITEAQMLDKIDAYIQTRHYVDAGPVPGAVTAIKELSKTYRLVIVTARTVNYRGTTEIFIEKYFPNVFSDILYSLRVDRPTEFIPKKELCRQVNAFALIDDSVRNLLPVVDAGMTGILFGDFAWHRQHILPERVIRCTSWEDVVVYLDRSRLADLQHGFWPSLHEQNPAVQLV